MARSSVAALAVDVERHEGQIQDLYARDEERAKEGGDLKVQLEKRFSETNLAIQAVGSRVTTIVVSASCVWAVILFLSRFF